MRTLRLEKKWKPYLVNFSHFLGFLLSVPMNTFLVRNLLSVPMNTFLLRNQMHEKFFLIGTQMKKKLIPQPPLPPSLDAYQKVKTHRTVVRASLAQRADAHLQGGIT